MKNVAEVVIIGGGIQGISLAYHLAKKGLSDVLVLEMNTLGSGSSGRSATVIGYAFQTENSLHLTQISLAAFERFQDELGAVVSQNRVDVMTMPCTLLKATPNDLFCKTKTGSFFFTAPYPTFAPC